MINFFNKKPVREKVVFSEHSYYPDFITDNPILFDLGACYGAFSKHFLEKFPNAKIVLVEANPNNFKKIEIESDNCTLLNKAVSQKENKIIFYEDENSSQNGSVLFNYFKGIKHEIETTNLEKLFENFNYIDLVKMDIEGAEWEVLLNAPSDAILKINQLSVEFHDFIEKNHEGITLQCVKRMKKLGYRLEYQSTEYMNGCKYYDCLFYKEKIMFLFRR